MIRIRIKRKRPYTPNRDEQFVARKREAMLFIDRLNLPSDVPAPVTMIHRLLAANGICVGRNLVRRLLIEAGHKIRKPAFAPRTRYMPPNYIPTYTISDGVDRKADRARVIERLRHDMRCPNDADLRQKLETANAFLAAYPELYEHLICEAIGICPSTLRRHRLRNVSATKLELRRRATLNVIRSIVPDKNDSIVVRHIHEELKARRTPIRSLPAVRRLLKENGYRIFGRQSDMPRNPLRDDRPSRVTPPRPNVRRTPRPHDPVLPLLPPPSSPGRIDITESLRRKYGIVDSLTIDERLAITDSLLRNVPALEPTATARLVGVTLRMLKWYRNDKRKAAILKEYEAQKTEPHASGKQNPK